MTVPAEIRRIATGDGPLLRQIRLRALAEDPGSFGSLHAIEATRSATEWAHRAERAARGDTEVIYLALDADAVVASVGAYTPEALTLERHIWGMWVAPEWRRVGLARELLRLVVRWAWSAGALRMTLWVATENTAAHRLYGTAGFVATGERRALPSAPAQTEVLMELRRV